MTIEGAQIIKNPQPLCTGGVEGRYRVFAAKYVRAQARHSQRRVKWKLGRQYLERVHVGVTFAATDFIPFFTFSRTAIFFK
jgi:hypothetical protein